MDWTITSKINLNLFLIYETLWYNFIAIHTLSMLIWLNICLKTFFLKITTVSYHYTTAKFCSCKKTKLRIQRYKLTKRNNLFYFFNYFSRNGVLYASAMVTSTSTPGSMLIDVWLEVKDKNIQNISNCYIVTTHFLFKRFAKLQNCEIFLYETLISFIVGLC